MIQCGAVDEMNSAELVLTMPRTSRIDATRRGCAGILWIALASMACGRSGTQLTELERAKSGMLDIVLLSTHDALRHGNDAFVMEFRSTADGKLVDVGVVRANATMPMSGMPMFGSIDVKRTDVAGRYTANGQFEMAGTWRMTVQWQGAAGHGSVTFSGTVR
jgi:YtkA-like protein